MEKPVRVKIFDHEYLIRSDEDEEQVQIIAQFVNDKFGEIKDNTKGLSELKIAILVSFHIAAEYFQTLKEHEDLTIDIQSRARTLNYHIDSILA